MSLESNKIEEIYAGKVARKYDFSVPPFFVKWKKKAFDNSSLKKGDTVLVFCCGTGLDFPPILKKIGKEGKIIGVDFSSEMLKTAREKIKNKKWENIELMEADVGVCTLGLSIIPEYKSAYYHLLQNVKQQGEIIIGDMQLASGWLSFFNPVTIALAKKFGGTLQGHQNSLELYAMMKKELTGLIKKEFFLGAYYFCVGKKK